MHPNPVRFVLQRSSTSTRSTLAHVLRIQLQSAGKINENESDVYKGSSITNGIRPEPAHWQCAARPRVEPLIPPPSPGPCEAGRPLHDPSTKQVNGAKSNGRSRTMIHATPNRQPAFSTFNSLCPSSLFLAVIPVNGILSSSPIVNPNYKAA